MLPSLHAEFELSWRITRVGRFGLEAHEGVVASDHFGVFADLEPGDRF